MNYYETLSFKNLLREAKVILDDVFAYFKNLIYHYQIRLDTPSWDIACYLTMLALIKKNDDTQVKNWGNFWKNTSHNRSFMNFVYRIPLSYHFFLFNDPKESFFTRLLDTQKHNKNVTWDTYLYLFFSERNRIYPKMNTNQKRVFQTILEIQNDSANLIAEKLEMKPSNVSKYKKEIYNRSLIFKGIILNHNKLNLANYILFAYSPMNKDEISLSLFDKSPFFHSLYLSNVGVRKYLINFLVPDHFQLNTDLLNLAHILKQNYGLTDVRVLKVDSRTRFRTLNYNSYNSKERKWKININQLLYTDSENDFLTRKKKIIPLFTDFSKTKLKIDSYTLDVLFELNARPLSSIKDIADKTGISETKVKERWKYLFKEQLVKFRFSPFHIFGLSTIVLFLNINKEENHNIHEFFSFLPEVYSSTYHEVQESSKKKEGILLSLKVPSVQVIESLDTLNFFFKNKIDEACIVNNMYSKRWYLPSNKFQTIFKEWSYEPGELLQLLDK